LEPLEGESKISLTLSEWLAKVAEKFESGDLVMNGKYVLTRDEYEDEFGDPAW